MTTRKTIPLESIADDWDKHVRPLVEAECAKAAANLRVFAISIAREHQTRNLTAGNAVPLDVFFAEGAKWHAQFEGETRKRAPYLAIDLTPDGKIQVTGHGCHIAGHGPFAIDDLKADEIKELIDSFVYAVTS